MDSDGVEGVWPRVIDTGLAPSFEPRLGLKILGARGIAIVTVRKSDLIATLEFAICTV